MLTEGVGSEGKAEGTAWRAEGNVRAKSLRRTGTQHRWRDAFTPLWERRGEETQPVTSRHTWSRVDGFATEVSLELGL